jgi:hypothetical protein
MAHGDTREGKWRGNWRMEWVASTLHTTSEHGVSSITIADAHTATASSRLNWSPRRFKWTRPFRRKTKSGFCACVITFQTQSTRYKHVSSAAVGVPWRNGVELHLSESWYSWAEPSYVTTVTDDPETHGQPTGPPVLIQAWTTCTSATLHDITRLVHGFRT